MNDLVGAPEAIDRRNPGVDHRDVDAAPSDALIPELIGADRSSRVVAAPRAGARVGQTVVMVEVDATIWGYADHRAVAAQAREGRSRHARHETVDNAKVSAHVAPEALHGFLRLGGHARGGSDDDHDARLPILTLRLGRGNGSGTQRGGEHEQAGDGREKTKAPRRIEAI